MTHPNAKKCETCKGDKSFGAVLREARIQFELTLHADLMYSNEKTEKWYADRDEFCAEAVARAIAIDLEGIFIDVSGLLCTLKNEWLAEQCWSQWDDEVLVRFQKAQADLFIKSA